MRTCLLGLIFITACYAPVLRSDIPCSTKRECPDGQSCSADGFCVFPGGLGPDGGASDGLSPDAPPGTIDTDKDGVPDTIDNCPGISNNDQLNEDGDTLGDACDLCPHVANNATTDSDGDGIPDACDPNPTGTTHDTRWLFEGFHAGLPTLWTADTGWGPGSDNGMLRVTAPSGGNTFEYLTLPLTSAGRTSFDNFQLIVAFTIDTSVSGGSEIGFDLYDSTGMRDAYCTLYEDSSGRHLGAYEIKSGGGTGADGTQPFSWQTGVQYTLTMTRRGTSGTTVTCNVVGPGGQPTKTATMNSVVVPRSGGASFLWAAGMTARVNWVYVAGTP